MAVLGLSFIKDLLRSTADWNCRSEMALLLLLVKFDSFSSKVTADLDLARPLKSLLIISPDILFPFSKELVWFGWVSLIMNNLGVLIPIEFWWLFGNNLGVVVVSTEFRLLIFGDTDAADESKAEIKYTMYF